MTASPTSRENRGATFQFPREEPAESNERARPETAPPSLGPSTVDIVIPVHNEERALRGCVTTLHERLRNGFPFPWRITIVDNASTDGTPALAEQLAEEMRGVNCLRLDRKGRGLALRTAWGDTDADIAVYMDVDLSTGLDGLLPLVAPLASGHSDMAIGSRLAPAARTVRGPRRELISRCYNKLIRLTHGSRFSDAQCGFKAIRTGALRPLLHATNDDAWFFDTELLLLAEHNGLRIHEVPVDWIEDTDSRVRVFNTAVDDLRGLWRIARRKRTGAARVAVPPRGPVTAEHPDAVLAPESKRSRLIGQVGYFALIGVLSTVGQAVLYWLLRQWWPAVAANFVSLLVLTVLNTEANRRLSFRDSGTGAGRAHIGAGGLFLLGYLVTSAAVLLYDSAASNASPASESVVLACASVLVTAIRFLLLRTTVFRRDESEPSRRESGEAN
ncbi:Glycosyltransferase involved in cell wall bisynthesis [Actinopolyspora xinjiangensis]|uniref:dolichyl-phosphate beta-glucosyltransferase n=1 Tax=Actinopolyspora xinjiangensis TaxID=405564 RepID=A0A1H0NX05_9ACTN|nr:bifunctional glycosyltransferase family 2/GtrA family protein [Actinopolyspora xinjiangensis]SDO97312.1 Glycosyltransferase involved in cell wall bisynthesis [Actinopolyspora xinjiangensis]